MSQIASPALSPAPFHRPPIWAWPLAVVVGFPIGGLVADLVVGPIDSVAAALAGGLIAGALFGVAEWLSLRRVVSRLWIAATSVGMAAGLVVGTAVVGYGTSLGEIVLMGAVTGAGVGTLQALVLARRRISGAAWWAIASPPAWALGWLVTSYVISTAVDERFTNFGAGGALVFGISTGLLLGWLLRRTEAEARPT